MDWLLCNSLHIVRAWPWSTRCWSRCASEPASGLELARRFDRSIGYFWHATHQQIYRVLGPDGGRRLGAPPRRSRRAAGPTRRCTPSPPPGAAVLRDWLAAPTPIGAAALRAGGQAARRVVRRPRRGPRTWPATTSPTTRPGSRYYEQLADARLPRPDRADRPRPRPVPRAARRDPAGGVLGRLAHRVPGGTRSRHARRPMRRMTTTPTCSRRSPSARCTPAQPRGDGLDAHRPRGPRAGTCPSWRRTSPSAPAAASA